MNVSHASAKLLLWFIISSFIVRMGEAQVSGQDLKLEVQLVWATNDKQSPDSKHTPVDADIRKKLEELPLKWTNYFRVNRNLLEVPAGSTKKASLSEKCSLEVKNVGHSLIEVSLFGKGEQVVKRTQSIPKGETLALGGNAPNSTAWLVVLRRKE
jgi:hypothetical protein